MCYHPIDIVNPSKYVSLKYHDPYIMQVPCGKCAACLTQKSNEWSYRLYSEAKSTIDNGGFVYFDTLTYNDANLPHISDYYSVDPAIDFPCFSSRHLRLFVAKLRQRVKRQFRSNFSYFIASEYGTSELHLHRPHYHVLFFVRGSVTPVSFSQLVSSSWSRGRTDGLPFRPLSHVLDNSFTELSAHAIRTILYVCKYIQKDTLFQKEIDKRLSLIMRSISQRFHDVGLPEWSSSSHYWRVRESISRCVSQFHRQSTALGESALSDIDLIEVFKTGALKMPHSKFVVQSIPLPTYYKRKLFYQQLVVDGAMTWQPTELGYQYIEARKSARLQMLIDKLKALSNHISVKFDVSALADYVLNFRGRFGSGRESTFDERLNNVSLFNYSNRYDREWFGSVGLSYVFIGNSSIGYSRTRPRFQPIFHFIRSHLYFDDAFESVLTQIVSFRSEIDAGRQRLFDSRQRLGNMIHHFFG